jgi:hypothetical protein
MRRQYFDYRPRTQFTVRGDRLEQMVWEQVRPLLEDPSRVADEYRRRISQASGEADPPEQVARLDHQITTIQRGIDRLIDCYAGGYIEKAEFEPRIAGLFTLRRSYAGAGLKPAPTCSRYTHLRRGDACVALWRQRRMLKQGRGMPRPYEEEKIT